MRPRSRTWIRSACLTVERRWAVRIVITWGAPAGPGAEAVAGRALEHLPALRVGRVGPHEEQVVPDRAGEELRVLGDEADLLAQLLEVDPVGGVAVVGDKTAARA